MAIRLVFRSSDRDGHTVIKEDLGLSPLAQYRQLLDRIRKHVPYYKETTITILLDPHSPIDCTRRNRETFAGARL